MSVGLFYNLAMGAKLIVLLSVFAAASAVKVNLTSQWKTNVGWEITCTWRLYENDSLQSVRLSEHDRQFLIYRPEVFGPKFTHRHQLPGKTFKAECENFAGGITGQCVMTIELLQPSSDDMNYACEVSGESPMFRLDMKTIDITALVPPSEAVVEVTQNDPSNSRVLLNCTSSGLPAPSLEWTVGLQKVPHDFSGQAWNSSSKLWDAWSLLSSSSDQPAICKPKTSFSGHTAEGASAIYSAASSEDALGIIIGVLTLITLTS